MVSRTMLALLLASAGVVFGPSCTRDAWAGLSSQIDPAHPAHPAHSANEQPTSPDSVEAQQFQINNGLIVGTSGSVSARQSVTAWQVTHGTWNGQALDGLSLVLVQTVAEDGTAAATTNCYISCLATPAQRTALLKAFANSRPINDQPTSPDAWRVEPAVIRIEVVGRQIVLHIGAIG